MDGLKPYRYFSGLETDMKKQNQEDHDEKNKKRIAGLTASILLSAALMLSSAPASAYSGSTDSPDISLPAAGNGIQVSVDELKDNNVPVV